MARNTKMKIAAVATALVASLGVAGASAAVSTDAGTTINHTVTYGGGHEWCC